MINKKINNIFILLNKNIKNDLPMLKSFKENPFALLISTVLSQRSKDETTLILSNKLFNKIGRTSKDFINADIKKIEKLIKKSGFYKVKAKYIKSISNDIYYKFKNIVPNNMEDLLYLEGVGRKTANIILGYAYNIPSIAVDTHVHRISNRLGIVKTQNPDQTEFKLQKIIPKKHWLDINNKFIILGKTICKPIKPNCDKCFLQTECKFYKIQN